MSLPCRGAGRDRRACRACGDSVHANNTPRPPGIGFAGRLSDRGECGPSMEVDCVDRAGDVQGTEPSYSYGTDAGSEAICSAKVMAYQSGPDGSVADRQGRGRRGAGMRSALGKPTLHPSEQFMHARPLLIAQTGGRGSPPKAPAGSVRRRRTEAPGMPRQRTRRCAAVQGVAGPPDVTRPRTGNDAGSGRDRPQWMVERGRGPGLAGCRSFRCSARRAGLLVAFSCVLRGQVVHCV